MDINEEEKKNLKTKISHALNRLNHGNQTFDDMINDYNILYKKYMNLLKRPENQRLYSFQVKSEEVVKTDQTELEKQLNYMKDEYLKEKKKNEKNIEEINEKMQQIMNLNNKLEIKDKKINGYSAENSALKQQNMILDKKNKELNETNNRNNKLIFELNKYNQKLEIDHKKLIDSAGKMHMEIDKLRTKLLELQENAMKKANQYNELLESVNQRQLFKREKSETFANANHIKLNINEIAPDNSNNDIGIKIPYKLQYKLKLHYKGMTSIKFNNSGSSYITTGEDRVIHIYNAEKNAETYQFSDFSDAITESCLDHKENFLFAGSIDKTAKLYSLKSYKLSYTFTGHDKGINCLTSLNTKDCGMTGSSDETVKEWDYNSKKMARDLKCGSECYSMCVSSDDKYLLTGQMDGTVKLFGGNDDKVEQEFKLHENKVVDIKLITNDIFLSLGKDLQIKLFDIRKGEALYTIDKNKIDECCESCITISPDKKYFAVGSNKGMIYIVNMSDGNISSVINNNRGSGSITTLNWRPNKSQIYAGDSNGFLSIWGNDFDI